MGFGVKLMPGVRVSVSSRGVRAGLGPRAARVHVGSGRTGISTGVGPLSAWTTLGGAKRRQPARRTPSMAEYERQVRAAERAAELDYWLSLNKAMIALIQAHEQSFEPRESPVAPPPEPVDEKAILRAHEQRELKGLGFFARSDRKSAKERALQLASSEAEAERHKRLPEHQSTQHRQDAVWAGLLANEPQHVFASIEDAFEDNEMPAACVDVDGSSATLLMRIAPVTDLIPERSVELTPTGKPTHKKRTGTEINQLYAELLGSHVMATVLEGFAVAPGLEEIRIVVVRGERVGGSTVLACLYAGRFRKAWLQQLSRKKKSHDVLTLLEDADGLIHYKGKTQELAALDLKEQLELDETLGTIAEQLGWRREPHHGKRQA
jgi:hypothetical protein